MKLKSRRAHAAKKGFTLVELIVVMAILIILAAVLVPLVGGYIDNAQASACAADRSTLMRSLQAQYALLTVHGQSVDAASLAEACREIYPSATFDGNKVLGVCPADGVYTVAASVTGTISVTCDRHSGADTSNASLQSTDFIAAMNLWIDDHGGLTKKGDFYADYYATHPAVKMDDAYRQKLVDAGLNKTIKGALYWWTYPVTDGSGNVIYTVTYANTASDTASWTNDARHAMDSGYVVIINGKTYIRTNNGHTVQPGYSATVNRTADALENDLIRNEYKVVQ